MKDLSPRVRAIEQLVKRTITAWDDPATKWENNEMNLPKAMSEHKFKVGDVVTTKPMKAWLNFDDAATVKVTMHSGRIEWFNRADLIPATDADVAEMLADACRYIIAAGENGDEATAVEKAQAAVDAYDALTSSGYTRSPKPDQDAIQAAENAHMEAMAGFTSAPPKLDVNQMMMEALKPFADLADYLEQNPGRGDGVIVIGPLEGNITVEAFYKARAAIAQ